MKNIRKVLLLSGLRIFPNQTGGHLRSGSFAKALARMGLDVQVYSLAGRKEDYGTGKTQILQVIEPRLEEEINLSLPFGLVQTLARRMGWPRLWQNPILASGLIPQSLRNALEWADCIICDLPFVPPIPSGQHRKPWLLLSHNLEHRLMEQGGFLDRHIFAAIMKRLEQSAPRRYDGIFACASEDYEFFQTYNSLRKPIQLVANGIDSAAYAPDPTVRAQMRLELGLNAEDRLIVFAGSRYAPNLEALVQLETFAKANADFLRAQAIKFLVLGSLATASRSDTIIATGFVPSVLPYFQAADFALNPVERGSGSNVKLFEYLAAHLPILSTEFGVRGSELQPGTDYIPFNWSSLRFYLESLATERSAAEWRVVGAEVWKRHASRSDMQEIVSRQWDILVRGLEHNSLRLVSHLPQSLSGRQL